MRQWTRDGTIPPHFYDRQDGNAYAYAPATVALGELVLELGRLFGSNSPIPKSVAKQVAPRLESLWREDTSRTPHTAPGYLSIRHGELEVRSALGFLARAKSKFAVAVA